MVKPTYDIRVERFEPLISPAKLKEALPMTEKATETVINGRDAICRILSKTDTRIMVITGPCSIHDEEAALEYARRLREIQDKVEETLLVVMRVYFEKPRTTVGWKGLINDPRMDGSYDMDTGLHRARALLLKITEMGLPTATEILDPITPQYIAGLVCWTAIGARTTESQTHREMASGLSMPVGFKNGTDGELETALNAMIAAGSPQSFLGIDANGVASIVKTRGNPFTHMVLRGGSRPNYDSASLYEAREMLASKGLNQAIVVDCSHANSRKKTDLQAVVWRDVINQRVDGNDAIVGLMLESHLFEGTQKLTGDPSTLQYGVSLTDPCISWETTEELLLSADAFLKPLLKAGTKIPPSASSRYRSA